MEQPAQAITVRDIAAHSWVEAYLGSNGWVRVDARRLRSGCAHDPLRQIMDAVEMFWSSWVIEYSASQQPLPGPQAQPRVRAGCSRLLPAWPSTIASADRRCWRCAAIPVAAVVAFARGKLPRRRAATNGPQRRRTARRPSFRVYQKTLDRLAARGLARRPEETPHEYLARVRQQGVVAADALAHLTDCLRGSPLRRHRGSSEIVSQMRAEAASIARDT